MNSLYQFKEDTLLSYKICLLFCQIALAVWTPIKRSFYPWVGLAWWFHCALAYAWHLGIYCYISIYVVLNFLLLLCTSYFFSVICCFFLVTLPFDALIMFQKYFKMPSFSVLQCLAIFILICWALIMMLINLCRWSWHLNMMLLHFHLCTY